MSEDTLAFILIFSIVYAHIGVYIWLLFVPKTRDIHDLIRVVLWAITWPVGVQNMIKEK